jgi:hypothetical protein
MRIRHCGLKHDCSLLTSSLTIASALPSHSQMATRMSLATVAVLVVSVVGLASATSYGPVIDSALRAAFVSDGFTVGDSDWVTYQGYRGVRGRSVNATIRSTGEHKPIYYVEGPGGQDANDGGYTMGYLLGLLAERYDMSRPIPLFTLAPSTCRLLTALLWVFLAAQ